MYGFVRVASAIPAVKVADPTFNIQQIKSQILQAEQQGAAVVCFPELSVTGYTCGDLFGQQHLLRLAEEALSQLLEAVAECRTIAIVGMPLVVGGKLANAAVVLQGNTLLGVVPKTYLPNYKEFYEQRWFTSADQLPQTDIELCGQSVPCSRHQLFQLADSEHTQFGIELCEDLWAPIPPSSYLATAGADIIFNLSATNELIAKHNYLCTLISQQSARLLAGYVYSSCGFGESTQDLVYGGNALIYENGRQIAASQRFSLEPQLVVADIDVENLRHDRRVNTSFRNTTQVTNTQTYSPPYRGGVGGEASLHRVINPQPFVPQGRDLDERCEEIFSIQVEGLAQRVNHTHARSLVIGISGGLDSTLALLVCARCTDLLGRPRTDIVGITMPGFGTTDRTHRNAVALMEQLGITHREIPIREACLQHFADIQHDPNQHDVTYENAQARERTQILMDVANQTGGFVVGTGDLSELALGWCTYNADHMSNYSVNCSVPKTLVRHLVRWVAENHTDSDARATLLDIIDTPISPELTPAAADGTILQQTEDLVGPYELHDFFLYHFLRHGSSPDKIYFLAQNAFEGKYSQDTIHHWLTTFCRRFFTQQFKRSCLPDGPKVGSVSLSPRGDWRMPSDASFTGWLPSK